MHMPRISPGTGLRSVFWKSYPMDDRRYRTLVVLTHPIQYSAPILREMANHPKIDLLAAYCSMQNVEPTLDPDFGVEVAWDIPLLGGYRWVQVPNQALRPGLGRFLGLSNFGLWKMVRSGVFDAVVTLTGYRYASFWIVLAAAKSSGVSVLFGTDAHQLAPRDGSSWKVILKRLFWPRLFKLADVVIVPSSGGTALMRSLGIPSEQIVLTPYSVDNDWWIEESAKVNRLAIRAVWRIPDDAPVILFCAKLQTWKRPQDVLRAFAQADIKQSFLVFAGDGPLRSELEAEAISLGVANRVRFLGFVNQTKLPAVYQSCDLFVLPSEYEPFGVVVNEAMLCGCPVIVSDCVGARFDLVQHGSTGFIYPVGDVKALCGLLCELLPSREQLERMGKKARERMTDWSPRNNVEGVVEAIERAWRLQKKSRNGRPK
jgi:glycosyltransferase involved in cell wall biosynthesis